jgi:hypothetical protein
MTTETPHNRNKLSAVLTPWDMDYNGNQLAPVDALLIVSAKI